jgi:AraC-like DNA-binding protein
MLIFLLFFITGIIGLTTMLIQFFKHKKNIVSNKYFTIIFTLSAIRFLLRGWAYYINGFNMDDSLIFLELVFLLTMPCLFLYFNDLIAFEKWKNKNLLHFIPGLICVLTFFIDFFIIPVPKILFKILFVLLLLNYATYLYLSYKLLASYILTRKSDIYIIKKQNNIIKNWAILLLTCFSFLFLRIIVLYTLNNLHYNLTSKFNYLWIGALVWLIMFFKILITPEILYGYDLLEEKINEYKQHKIVLNNVWKLNYNTTIKNIKDLKIQEKMTSNLKEYIVQIEDISLNSDIFRDYELTIETFSKKLTFPTFHLIYIFRYHSNISFIDYKKIIRIQDAIQLMKTNFLITNTYETLSNKVGFNSYMTFYTCFINITGMSPQDYYKKIKEKKLFLIIETLQVGKTPEIN